MPGSVNWLARMLVRIVTIILPVLLMILIGWLYGRRARPDMSATNRINMDICVPMLVFSALDRIQALGKKLGVTGTPALVFGNGQLVAGAIPREDIDKLLSSK